MKLKMLVGLQGPAISLEPGDQYECADDSEATRLISARYAIPWSEPEIERAVKAAPPETRTTPSTAKPRRRAAKSES